MSWSSKGSSSVEDLYRKGWFSGGTDWTRDLVVVLQLEPIIVRFGGLRVFFPFFFYLWLL